MSIGSGAESVGSASGGVESASEEASELGFAFVGGNEDAVEEFWRAFREAGPGELRVRPIEGLTRYGSV